jgi:hypothetical protein
VTKAPKAEAAPPPWKDPALCLFALFARQFTLARETCRTRIGGTDSAMRMVSPNAFWSYGGEAHRGLVTCHGNKPGKLDTNSFTASGLSKITLPNGCSAETDTHIFAVANDGFDRAETDYIVAYVWPFDPLTLTPGLDTKKFSEIPRGNLTNLANNIRHNIPLEIALQAVGAEYGVPMDLNQVLDNHHYVTVPLTVLILFVGSPPGGSDVSSRARSFTGTCNQDLTSQDNMLAGVLKQITGQMANMAQNQFHSGAGSGSQCQRSLRCLRTYIL